MDSSFAGVSQGEECEKLCLRSLIIFKAHLWPPIVFKPWSTSTNGPRWLAPDALRPRHVQMGNYIKTGGRWCRLTEAPKAGVVDGTTESGELPRAGLALLLVKNDLNLTGLGLIWDQNNRIREVSRQSPNPLRETFLKCGPGSLVVCKAGLLQGELLMLSLCCWRELVITYVGPHLVPQLTQGHPSSEFSVFFRMVSGCC